MSKQIKANLLIVDDETAIRNTLVRILQGIGSSVTSAASAAEALRRIEQDKPGFDLAILDLRLPDMNGIELLKEIRKTHARLPVILLTGHGSLNTAMEALHLGAVDYLLKPIHPDTLIECTKKALHRINLERKRSQLSQQIIKLQAELNQIDLRLASYPDMTLADLEMESSQPAAMILETISPSQARYLTVGDLEIDLQGRKAGVKRETEGVILLDLRPSSFDYLVVLVRHTPDTVPYQDLVAEAQGYQASLANASQLAKWHIHHLRLALAAVPGSTRQILNVRGSGYRLVID